MWTTSKQKFSNIMEKITGAVNLNPKKTISWYSYVLFFTPIAFWLLIEMQILASGKSWMVMLKQPTIAIATLIAIIDFMLGYYLVLRKKDVLASYENYRLFMMWQAVCQILVGNFICFFLALIGIYEAKFLKNGQYDATVKMVSFASGLFLIICFGFIVLTWL